MKNQILLNAAQIIEARGWVQGHYSIPNKKNPALPGPVCLSRAINEATRELGASEEDRYAARDAVGAVTGAGYCLAGWNDRGKTTKQDVIRVLTEAADK